MNQPHPDLIPLGFITKAHGIKGVLCVHLIHPDGESLRPGIKLTIVRSKSEPLKTLEIDQVLSGDRVQFKGIHDRTEAEKWIKSEIFIQRSDFIDIPDDEVYLSDLIGFSAVDLEGKPLGEVSGFTDNRAQILVELSSNVLVPFIKPFLVKIDEEAEQIVLDLPEGYDL
ncbi:MAG: ribosome maturation factor RimM [Myxococcota bacterium]